MKKKRSYSDSVHFYGIIWDIAALLVFMMIPVSICLHLNVWPEAKYIFKGLLPVAMIFYPSAVIEVLTYTPLLGAGGTYLGRAASMPWRMRAFSQIRRKARVYQQSQ